LRYSWIERVWTGVRVEIDEVTEWCGECTGVMGAVSYTWDRGDREYGS
jgi:hypothetical protein